MRFENTEVWGFNHALRGMRNPLESWDKSDSYYCMAENCDCDSCNIVKNCPVGETKYNFDRFSKYITGEIKASSIDDCVELNPTNTFVIGENDLNLAQRLIKGGTEHRKFLRQIMVSVDITAPLFFYKEMDTYKVGTTANSTSTMHKLATTPITLDCFETGDVCEELLSDGQCGVKENIIPYLEWLRVKYLETKDKRYWKELIRWLPESWLQTRTVTLNYENLRNMYFQRRNHKLTEWSVAFCDWVKTLPYAEELICYESEN